MRRCTAGSKEPNNRVSYFKAPKDAAIFQKWSQDKPGHTGLFRETRLHMKNAPMPGDICFKLSYWVVQWSSLKGSLWIWGKLVKHKKNVFSQPSFQRYEKPTVHPITLPLRAVLPKSGTFSKVLMATPFFRVHLTRNSRSKLARGDVTLEGVACRGHPNVARGAGHLPPERAKTKWEGEETTSPVLKSVVSAKLSAAQTTYEWSVLVVLIGTQIWTTGDELRGV